MQLYCLVCSQGCSYINSFQQYNLDCVLGGNCLAFTPADVLAYPEDRRCKYYHGQEFECRQGCDPEHFAAKLNQKNLSKQDDHGHEQEAAAFREVCQGGTGCAEGAGIEKVPELQHDEGGEEDGLVASGCVSAKREDVREAENQDNEKQQERRADAKNECLHVWRDDERVC